VEALISPSPLALPRVRIPPLECLGEQLVGEREVAIIRLEFEGELEVVSVLEAVVVAECEEALVDLARDGTRLKEIAGGGSVGVQKRCVRR